MFITVKEFEFLCELESELGQVEGWSDRVNQLWELNERLKAQKEKENIKQRDLMRRKRAKSK